MKRWHVWTEEASRDDAAVILAWSARAAACAFAESHEQIADGTSFELLVAGAKSHDVKTFEFECPDVAPRIDPFQRALSHSNECVASARASIAELSAELEHARRALAQALLDRERWLVRIARAERDDALRRQGTPDGETRRHEAAGE